MKKQADIKSRLRDNMIILALHAGLSGSYSLHKKKGYENKIGEYTSKLNFDSWRINIAPTKNEVTINSTKAKRDKINITCFHTKTCE